MPYGALDLTDCDPEPSEWDLADLRRDQESSDETETPCCSEQACGAEGVELTPYGTDNAGDPWLLCPSCLARLALQEAS